LAQGELPEEAEALNDLGVIYYTEARSTEDKEEKDRLLGRALELFRQALQKDPALVTAINNLGLIELERGNLEAALAKFNEALALEPEYARALNNRGLAYRRLAQRTTDEAAREDLFAKAKADFLAGIAKEPETADLHYNLALLEEDNLKNPVAAAEQYRKTVELDPRNATALNNLSVFLQESESTAERQEAVLLARRAVEIRPAEACMVDTLARALLAAGDCANALETANRAIELQSKGAGRLRCNQEEIRSLPKQIEAQCPALSNGA
ncbi:MAG TPA: tetratricopeptide repeat protein, partial [Thermoanaerobaculia bacterium]|nr:tetratricopeptide repeat protein [Thermoanaerobaculia bacterium]